MKPDDVTVIDDGDGIYAVFAGNRRAREIVLGLIPTLQFGANPKLPKGTMVAGCLLCCEKCAEDFCAELREAGLSVTLRSRLQS
jgi:hypothetical protein